MQKSMLLPQSNIKILLETRGKWILCRQLTVSAADIHILIAFNSIVITLYYFSSLDAKRHISEAFDLHGLNLKTFYLQPRQPVFLLSTY